MGENYCAVVQARDDAISHDSFNRHQGLIENRTDKGQLLVFVGVLESSENREGVVLRSYANLSSLVERLQHHDACEYQQRDPRGLCQPRTLCPRAQVFPGRLVDFKGVIGEDQELCSGFVIAGDEQRTDGPNPTGC
jgi:hypothetical protein